MKPKVPVVTIYICLFALKNQYVDQIEKSGTYFHVTLA